MMSKRKQQNLDGAVEWQCHFAVFTSLMKRPELVFSGTRAYSS